MKLFRGEHTYVRGYTLIPEGKFTELYSTDDGARFQVMGFKMAGTTHRYDVELSAEELTTLLCLASKRKCGEAKWETIRADIGASIEHLKGAILGSESKAWGVSSLESLESSFNEIIEELKKRGIHRNALQIDYNAVKHSLDWLSHYFGQESATKEDEMTARVFGEYLWLKIAKVPEAWAFREMIGVNRIHG